MMNKKNLVLHILLPAIMGVNNLRAQLQVQKLKFDLDKDGVTDTVWFNIDKGRLEVMLSTRDGEVIHTPFLFDPVKIYNYQLIQEEQEFRLYIMNFPLITDALFYYDEKEKRIRLKKMVTNNRKNPPGHGHEVITIIDLLTGAFTEKRAVYQVSTDEFIDEVYTGKGSFQPIYLEEYKITTGKEILDSLTLED